MTIVDPSLVLADLIRQHGTQANVAPILGVSKEMVSHLVTRKRAFSDLILFRLGLERVIVKRQRAA